MSCPVRKIDALAHQQFPNLRESEPVPEPAANRVLLRATAIPVVTPRPTAARVEREQHIAELRLDDRAVANTQPDSLGGGDIPTDRFRIESQACGDALLATPSRQRRLSRGPTRGQRF